MNTVENNEREAAELMLEDAKAAAKAIGKGSRLRMHYIKLVTMNNVLRAFVAHYSLPRENKNTQDAFLRTLIRVEERKNRQWLSSDKIALSYALELYDTILNSATDDQIREILLFIEANRDTCAFVVTEKK